MRRHVVLVIILIGVILIAAAVHLTSKPDFSCESQFSIVQHINADELRAEGLIFLDQQGNNLLIKVDGLLTHNDKKYIISRTLKMKYEPYNIRANLYKVVSVKTNRDNTDNINDEVTNGFMFGESPTGEIIFIKRVADDVILFGDHTFPQYGCRRH